MTVQNFGIENINDISSYVLKTNGDKDELIIKLKEKRFGFFNKQHKAVFKRHNRMFSSHNEVIQYNEISPILLRILDDLDASHIKNKRSIFQANQTKSYYNLNN